MKNQLTTAEKAAIWHRMAALQIAADDADNAAIAAGRMTVADLDRHPAWLRAKAARQAFNEAYENGGRAVIEGHHPAYEPCPFVG